LQLAILKVDVTTLTFKMPPPVDTSVTDVYAVDSAIEMDDYIQDFSYSLHFELIEMKVLRGHTSASQARQSNTWVR
jgi:hypothetical protein